MNQQILFDEVPLEKLSMLSKEDLLILFKGEQSLRRQLQKRVQTLEALNEELKQKKLFVEEHFIDIKNKLYGKSSERVKTKSQSEKKNKGTKTKKKKIQLPSERYPNLPLIERQVEFETIPNCKCCGNQLKDSGLVEESEFLTKVPAQFYVVVQMRHKYNCSSCHGDMQTAPSPPRITPGSSYSDELSIDVSMSKYCDLIPVERYANIAKREGVKDLPPQSLIQTSHEVADFVKIAYRRLKNEILVSKYLNADETPHRMLEGHDKSRWYLWGFSNQESCYFECHETRSGDVASKLLIQSRCEYLMSDVYSGYAKSVRETNLHRKENSKVEIQNLYCNSHARRYFKKAQENYDDAEFYIQKYQSIYRLEELKKKFPEKHQRLRNLMRPLFEQMKAQAMADLGGYSEKSSFGKAMNYFLKNYDGFTKFLKNPELPIDNNHQERLLRNSVIGRKTWYGTHSVRGAETAAILFSLVESCKLNKINPREYFRALVKELHEGKSSFTPREYKLRLSQLDRDKIESEEIAEFKITESAPMSS